MDIVQDFESSFLRKLVYNEETQELIIHFTGNKEYIHENVPVDVWLGFKEAESKGKYYTANIKGRYIAEKYLPKSEEEKKED